MSAEDPACWPPERLVFTDLDGTLLDHDSYDFSPALGALAVLRGEGIPVVLCSSKTRAEMVRIQQQLGIEGPFIPENGGAVLLSGGGSLVPMFPDRHDGLPARVFGAPYAALRQGLGRIRTRFGPGVCGFGDVDAEVIVRWTGLPRAEAELAQLRDFDEPFLWEPEPSPSEAEEMRRELAGSDLRLTRGGRFWHILGANDKGRAVRWLLDALAACWQLTPAALALGDSENDLPMLLEVDAGVLVERPGGGHLRPRPDAVKTVAGIGPVGWSRAVLEWLGR